MPCTRVSRELDPRMRAQAFAVYANERSAVMSREYHVHVYPPALPGVSPTQARAP